MHSLFLGLGSNLGDKQNNILQSYAEIEKRIGNIVSQSAFYITTPEGFESDNDFQNSVCKVSTSLSLHQVFVEVLNIEKHLGRASKSINGIYADRLIDIDILMYDDLVIDTDQIIIPHPRLHLRNFVLEPFAEIAPCTVHPVLNKTIEQLKKDLTS